MISVASVILLCSASLAQESTELGFILSRNPIQNFPKADGVHIHFDPPHVPEMKLLLIGAISPGDETAPHRRDQILSVVYFPAGYARVQLRTKLLTIRSGGHKAIGHPSRYSPDFGSTSKMQ
jgi:hypothetical protein